MFKGFKAVLWCHGVVACKDNNKVDRCRNNGVINRAVNRAVDSFVSVDSFVDRVWISWEMSERVRELYLTKIAGFVIAF